MDFFTNPYVAAGSAGLGTLADIYLSQNSPQAKYQKWALGETPNLYAMIMGMMKNRQPAIGPGQQNNMMSQFSQSMKPTFGRLTAGGTRMGSLSSPDIQRMLAGEMLGPTAQFSNAIGMKNAELTNQNQQGYLQALLSLLSGGGR